MPAHPDDDPRPDHRTAAQLGDAVRASAQQIWLAGLGAFAKAQEEGGKVFEALVREGSGLQRRTQSLAEERLSEASERVTHIASEIGTKAVGGWDKLESIFEQRVAKALRKLGVPSADDIAQLSARIEELNRSVHKLTATQPCARRARRPRPQRCPLAASVPARPRLRASVPARRAPDLPLPRV